MSTEKSAEITAAMADAAGVDTSAVSVAFTSSTWGAEITEKAVRALIVFFIVVSLFISVRFEWRMAVAAFAAMVHDVIAVVGVYSVFQFEVSPATVVAFLTILGYSLYDTIVVFDRVKENQAKFSSVRTPYPDIVNISMNQVLMRSLNTSIASILPVLSLLAIGWGLLGAEALEEFALALFIGMVVGVYSSIFIATPLLASMHRDTSGKVRRERLTGAALRAAVVGSSATGRDASHVLVKVGADESAGSESSVGVDDQGGTAPPPRTESGASPERLLIAPATAAQEEAPLTFPAPTGILGTWQASTARCGVSSETSATTRSTGSRSATSHRCSETALPSPRRSTAWSNSSTALPVDRVVGVESRGFIFAAAVAYRIGAGFVPVRKAGKLPWAVVREEYQLEYGTDKLEIHRDAIHPGERILIIDDVLATGGTAAATAVLVETLGGVIAGLGFVIELDALGGRSRLGERPVRTLLHY